MKASELERVSRVRRKRLILTATQVRCIHARERMLEFLVDNQLSRHMHVTASQWMARLGYNKAPRQAAKSSGKAQASRDPEIGRRTARCKHPEN